MLKTQRMFAHEKPKKANGEMRRKAERNVNGVGKKGGHSEKSENGAFSSRGGLTKASFHPSPLSVSRPASRPANESNLTYIYN